ncbi:MAG TPA: hypothetical protein VJ436_00595 [Anaerolineales bacterium]|nr:hypothetical protein [Anaerolineales bacterium]
MESEPIETRIARRSAAIYLPISLGAALVFLLATALLGEFPAVAKVGGAVWVGLLSLIISMPLVTAAVKKQQRAS